MLNVSVGVRGHESVEQAIWLPAWDLIPSKPLRRDCLGVPWIVDWSSWYRYQGYLLKCVYESNDNSQNNTWWINTMS